MTCSWAAPLEEDLVLQIRRGAVSVVDTRSALARSVEGFLPDSIRGQEYSTKPQGVEDIRDYVFLVDTPEVETEVCGEEVRCYTGGMEPFADLVVFPEDVDFQALGKLLENKKIVLIDVRTPEELVTDGKIPGSVNLPLADIPDAFTMDKNVFKEKYGFDLPSPSARDVVLTCRSAS